MGKDKGPTQSEWELLYKWLQEDRDKLWAAHDAVMAENERLRAGK